MAFSVCEHTLDMYVLHISVQKQFTLDKILGVRQIDEHRKLQGQQQQTTEEAWADTFVLEQVSFSLILNFFLNSKNTLHSYERQPYSGRGWRCYAGIERKSSDEHTDPCSSRIE